MNILKLKELEKNNPKPKILIVDDDEVVLDLLKHFITFFGYECVLASDGVEAVEALNQDAFDIIVTDIMMPRMDGMDLLKFTTEHFPDTDVIIVTGYAGAFSYVDVIKAGAIDFISKPFNEDELEAKLNRVLRERRIIKELELLSIRDPLTGLFNRRHFDDKLTEEAHRAHRQGYKIYMGLLDIDKFKNYNDTFGHQEGDKVLIKLGEILLQGVRKNVDWCFRYGGDEFAIIIPQAEEEHAREAGQRILTRYQACQYATTSLSIGFARLMHEEKFPLEESVSSLIRSADKALYLAKKKGGGA